MVVAHLEACREAGEADADKFEAVARRWCDVSEAAPAAPATSPSGVGILAAVRGLFGRGR